MTSNALEESRFTHGRPSWNRRDLRACLIAYVTVRDSGELCSPVDWLVKQRLCDWRVEIHDVEGYEWLPVFQRDRLKPSNGIWRIAPWINTGLLADFRVKATLVKSANSSWTLLTLKSASKPVLIDAMYVIIAVGDSFSGHVTGTSYTVNHRLDCNSRNVVYLINCKVCGLQKSPDVHQQRKWKNSTELSKYVWELKSKSSRYTIGWKILEKAKRYTNLTGKCQLCTAETLHHHKTRAGNVEQAQWASSAFRQRRKFILRYSIQ